MKKVLNVGGGHKGIPLPPLYAGFEHLLLDIDPRGEPDILCDARRLETLAPAQFDAVYCSHNLEHYRRHEVPQVLRGFLHVLKPEGFVQIAVPDIQAALRKADAQGLDLDDVLYQSAVGPITVLDVIYGYHVEIERSGQDFYAHKTGFSVKSLGEALIRAGFSNYYGAVTPVEIVALAFRQPPSPELRTSLGLPAEG